MNELKFDLYIAAMGRSGSTMIANWLTLPKERQFVFVEPSLSGGAISQHLQAQMTNLGLPMTADDVKVSDFLNEMADARWGVKEVQSLEHKQIGRSIHPSCTIILVRDVDEVYLSLVEKHRVQGVEDNYTPAWSAEYCRREAQNLLALSRDNPEYQVFRYHEFISSAETRARLCSVTGFNGGGVVDRNFRQYGRDHEAAFFAGQIAERTSPRERICEADRKAAAQLVEECADYRAHFGYS